MEIRKQYGIPDSAKMLLYVGNIGINKNQSQMIETFPLLEEALREETYVLFLGRPSNEIDIKKMIAESPYSNHLFFIGGVDKSQMVEFYKAADATILLSHTEGFGLSLIEGMSFGLPCAMFVDMDAFEDIYTPCAVVGIPSRSNEEVVSALEMLLRTKWDKEKIISYAQKFNRDSMADSYLQIFSSI